MNILNFFEFEFSRTHIVTMLPPLLHSTLHKHYIETPTIQEAVRASCCTYVVRFANKKSLKCVIASGSEQKVESQTGQLQKRKEENASRAVQENALYRLCQMEKQMPLIYKVAPYMLQNVKKSRVL
jgi:hypothetical protein